MRHHEFFQFAASTISSLKANRVRINLTFPADILWREEDLKLLCVAAAALGSISPLIRFVVLINYYDSMAAAKAVFDAVPSGSVRDAVIVEVEGEGSSAEEHAYTAADFPLSAKQ